ncbi:Uma2 family endonuclease [Streptomyces zagrosensis]|uniref:Uma2 family endonuclease n=1 Tax=Streptomyces zagrosensis TaxID=1042984 RepID=A0A7W9Q5B4_9ACTN|nr:Uma2 family endonuclease [Streptomyces zagrosensis]MBB5933851.1 Uma2 family endonuclease [Streptomyces zagrosensis]
MADLGTQLPEGFHAEIVAGFIEVSPTGRLDHGQIANRLRRALDRYLQGSGYAAHQDINVIHGLKPWVPDVFVGPEGPEDREELVPEDRLGVRAGGVRLVAEVVSPGRTDRERDRVRKRRAYAQAGIPVYVLIDDYDNHGTTTVLTNPSAEEGVYAAAIRVPYGTDVDVPEGPAKGFVITEAMTGPRRAK